MKISAISLLLAASLVVGGSSVAAPVKSSGHQLGAIGTSQMPGDQCSFGTAYTLGSKGNYQINFTAISGEYLGSRLSVNPGGFFELPSRGEKLLVVHFSLQNPMKAAQGGNQSIHIVAVDDQGVNHAEDLERLETSGVLSGGGTSFDQNLLPGQKCFVAAIFHIPGNCSIVKLVVAKNSDAKALVARYDAHGHIKPLSAPFADPSDPSGATLAATINGEVGKTYAVGVEDVTVEKVEFQTTNLFQDNLKPDQEYAIVTMSWKNLSRYTGRAPHGYIFLKDEDGSTIDADFQALAASGDRKVDIEPQIGETVRFRSVYIVHKGVALRSINFLWTEINPTSIDLSAYKAP